MIMSMPYEIKLVLYETMFGCFRFFSKLTSIIAPSYSPFCSDPSSIFFAMYSFPPSILFFTKNAAPNSKIMSVIFICLPKLPLPMHCTSS